MLDTRISPGPASDEIREPVTTAMPATLSPTSSHSPMCTPARSSRSIARARSMIALAHAIARAGPSNRQKKPSPAVSTSTPRWRESSARTSAWCRVSRSRQARSPTCVARSVDATRSVNNTVARTESGTVEMTSPRRNSRITPAASWLNADARSVVTGTVTEPGMRSATNSAGPPLNSSPDRWMIRVGTRIA